MIKQKYDIDRILGKPFFEYEKIHALSKWPERAGRAKKSILKREIIEEINLPKALNLKVTFRQALLKRRSSRDFSSHPVSTLAISTLLSSSNYHPSLGNIYPLDIYLIILNCEIEKGVYRYNIPSHRLQLIKRFDKVNTKSFFNQERVANAEVLLIITSRFDSTMGKYSSKGYRYILAEAGHIGQNIYYAATALNLAVCEVGGYLDSKLEKFLHLNPTQEAILSVIVFGNKYNEKVSA